MIQKPTKNSKVGFLNLIPYPFLVLGIKFIHVISYFPRPLAVGIVWLVSVPVYLLREVKRRLKS